jgi:type VI secretion system Hcp family effector
MNITSAPGESLTAGYEKWIELQAWEWEVEAETSWTKGGGAAVGKPNPGKLSWEHYWDKSSTTILSFICTGTSFDTIQLEMCKGVGVDDKGKSLKPFFKALMRDSFITKVSQSATEEGNLVQKVEMVFKYMEIDYWQQGTDPRRPGQLVPAGHYDWDIPGGTVNKSSPRT